ncbi:Stomatin-like protein 2 [Hordeum vulgare]|nr:Stomatin-like protein 2 [Hordeum vulgare]
MLARSAVPDHLLRSAASTANPAVATVALLQRRWYREGVDHVSCFYDPSPTPTNLGLSIIPEKKAFVVERFGKYLLPSSWRMVTCSSDGYDPPFTATRVAARLAGCRSGWGRWCPVWEQPR